MASSDDLLAHVLRAVRFRLNAEGVLPGRSEALLADAEQEVRCMFGAERVYVASSRVVQRSRDMAIRAEHAAGKSVPLLSRDYRLSQRQIRNILASGGKD